MLIEHLNRRRRERDAAALQRVRRIAESPCAPLQRVSTRDGGTREMLSFCSNDYLGLANHPALVDAIADGARRFGVGSGASHLISGHTRAHQALEDELGAWFAPFIPGAQALGFGTGYLANLALLTTLAEAEATVFADKLNHASLVDGALLATAIAKAAFRRFAHGRLDVLERELAACTTPIKLIVADAVFSMDGDLADVPAMLALAERHDAWIVLDDAHGFGVLGAGGRGTLAHFGLSSERFIVMGTLGKAAGVGGAFVAAHPAVIDALVQSARAYIYTTAAPPAVAHAALASLAWIGSADGDARRAHLTLMIVALRERLAALIADRPGLGWRLMDSATAIQPLVVGDNAAALALAAGLDLRGLRVPAIRPPTVPIGSARLRITLSAAHTLADVERLVDALAAIAGDAVASTDPAAAAVR